MAEQLKAVVSVTADTSGLIRGVEGAMAKLNAMSRNVSILAGLSAAQAALGTAERVIGILQRRSDELGRFATEFDPTASRAQMERQLAELSAQKQMGAAMAPSVVAQEMIAAQSAREEAARVTAGAEEIGMGRLRVEAVGDMFTQMGKAFVDDVLARIGGKTPSGTEIIGVSAAFEAGGQTQMLADALLPIVTKFDRLIEKIGGEP